MRVQWISRRPWPGATCVTKYRLKYHKQQKSRLLSQAIRTDEFQVWFLAEHLVNVPLTLAE